MCTFHLLPLLSVTYRAIIITRRKYHKDQMFSFFFFLLASAVIKNIYMGVEWNHSYAASNGLGNGLTKYISPGCYVCCIYLAYEQFHVDLVQDFSCLKNHNVQYLHYIKSIILCWPFVLAIEYSWSAYLL